MYIYIYNFIGSYYQLFLLKQKYPHLKLILSIGGWANSQRFSKTFSTEQSRFKLIESITNWFYKYPFFEGVGMLFFFCFDL